MKIRRRKASRYSRTSTSGGSVTATQTAKGTKSFTSRAPSTSTATSTTPGFTEVDTGDSGPGGTGGLFVALTVLYVVALWNGFFKNWWTTIWTGTKTTSNNGWIAAGGLLFIFLMVGLARISKQWEQAMWVMTIGMWLIYFMFNGQQQLQSTVNKTSTTQQQSQQPTETPKGNIR